MRVRCRDPYTSPSSLPRILVTKRSAPVSLATRVRTHSRVFATLPCRAAAFIVSAHAAHTSPVIS